MKEKIRNLVFMGATIVMGFVICIISFCKLNYVGAILAVALLFMLGVEFGYLFNKYEPDIKKVVREKTDKHFVEQIMGVKPKTVIKSEEVEKVEPICDYCEENAKNILDKAE